MLLPHRKPERVEDLSTVPQPILDAFEHCGPILEVHKSRDYILVLPSEQHVRRASPCKATLDRINLDPGGVVITAASDRPEEYAFVSRYNVG